MSTPMNPTSPAPEPKPAPDRQRPRRAWRRWLLVLFLLLIGVTAAFIGFLPQLLSTPAGNREILARINRRFAPGSVKIEHLRLSWTEPTRLTDVVLQDAAGKVVLTSPTGSIDRSLWSFLFHERQPGTLRLDGTALDLERRPDGSINLVEALGDIFDRPDPRRDLKIRLVGSLNAIAGELRQPLHAERFDFELHLRPQPAIALWTLKLDGPDVGKAGLIEASGQIDRWRQTSRLPELPDLAAHLRVSDWPWQGVVRNVTTNGQAAGGLSLKRQGGRWESDGDLQLAIQGARPWEMEGQAPSLLGIGWKSWTEDELLKLTAKLDVDRLGRHEGPLSAEIAGDYRAKADSVRLDAISLNTDWGRFEASGKLDEISGRILADLQGQIQPDYRRITEQLAARVEPNARVMGSPATWSIKGPLVQSDATRRPLDLMVRLGLAIDEADVYGMKLGKTSIAGTYQDGSLLIQPIETTLNGGTLKLQPTVDLDAPGGAVVRLGSDTSLSNAQINDEVSGRVLSFVAPVLNRATQVNGRVSADLTSAEFPLARDGGRKAKVEGNVVFSDVTFAAGPLSKDLLALVIKDQAKLDNSKLILDQPVRLSIADGRVEQHGLGLPVGKLARVEMDGWVDFDRTIKLEATIPLNPDLFPNAPLLKGVARATRVRIPISGTLDQPKVDASAMKANLSEMGRDLLIETGTQGVMQLFSRLNRPKDPNAPPPPPRLTPAERKALRLEKKAERQMKRNQGK